MAATLTLIAPKLATQHAGRASLSNGRVGLKKSR
jgi:hypothetical protein